jgi:anti-sigma B factor antagonist
MAEPNPAPDERLHEPFRIEVTTQPDGALVRLIGSCSMEHALELTERLICLASELHPLVVLDMSELDFIESSGLGGIIAAYLRCRKRNADLRLVAPKPAIQRILRLTRLTDLFSIYDSAEQAFGRTSA